MKEILGGFVVICVMVCGGFVQAETAGDVLPGGEETMGVDLEKLFGNTMNDVVPESAFKMAPGTGWTVDGVKSAAVTESVETVEAAETIVEIPVEVNASLPSRF